MPCPENHYTRAEVAAHLGYPSDKDMSAFLKAPKIKKAFPMAWTPGGHYLPKDDAGMLALLDKRTKHGAMPEPAAEPVMESPAAEPAPVSLTDIITTLAAATAESPAPAAPEVKEGLTARIEQFMLADLAKSGLNAHNIGAHISPVEGGYVIPYFNPDGTPMARMYRVRLTPEAAAKIGHKYSQPAKDIIGNDAVHPYFPRGWDHFAGDGILDIHEGEKKAACAIKHANQAAIAIGGCHNWHDPKVKGEVHPAILKAITARNIKIVRLWPDGDIKKVAVQMGWGGLARKLKDAGISVTVMDISGLGSDAKFDDVVAAKGIGYLMENVTVANLDNMVFSHVEMIRQLPELVVQTKELRDRKGNVTEVVETLIPMEHNLMVILRRHPVFAGQLWYDEDRMQYMYGDRPWDGETTIMETLTFLQSKMCFNGKENTAKATTVAATMVAVAKANKRSPFRDYLQGLQWDGVPRLSDWLVQYCHAEDSPVVREAGKRFLVGLVHRVFEPGCFHRWMLILAGPQKIGKSGLGMALVGQHNVADFKDGMSPQDEMLLMHSCLVLNMDELVKYQRASDLLHLMAQISAPQDTFRAPYERAPAKHLRHCVMIGSLNPEEDEGFLRHNPSGNNRFVVVPVSSMFDFAGLAEARDQLFAEAVALCLAGYEHESVPGADEHAQRFEKESPFMEPIVAALRENKLFPVVVPISKENGEDSGFRAVFMHDACYVLGKSIERQDHTKAIGQALRAIGFKLARTPPALGGKGKMWKIETAVLDGLKERSKGNIPVAQPVKGFDMAAMLEAMSSTFGPVATDENRRD